MRPFQPALLLCASLAACAGSDSPPAGAPPEAPAGSAAARPLSPVEKLQADIVSAPFGAADLPAGVSVIEGVRETPSAVALGHGAEAKLTVNLKGPSASDRISFTLYPSAEAAARAFADIGKPVPDRNVVSRTPVPPELLPAPGWGESTVESYGEARIARTSIATTSGLAVVLAQSIVEARDGAEPRPDPALTAALLRAGAGHLARLQGLAAAPPAAPAAAPAAATPSPSTATD